MIKITFMGAGSTVFARNVLGDCMCTPALRESEIALYDIDEKRLEDSRIKCHQPQRKRGPRSDQNISRCREP